MAELPAASSLLGPPTSSTQPLVDVLDQILDAGVVVDGQIVLSVAGVDLVHIGLRALLASTDTALRAAGQVRVAKDPA